MRYISRRCSVTPLFCIALNPLSALLDKSAYGYRFKGGTTINHLLYMDNNKLYAKNEQDIDSLIHLTRVFSYNIGMTFGQAKRECLIVNRGKVKSTSGISLPEGRIDDINKSYKYLGVLQSFGNNDKEMIAINTFTFPVIRYPAAVVSWRRKDLEKTDIGSKNLMTIHGVFHLR